MDNFEFNKIFAAILTAGIIAMLAGFIADKMIHPHELEKSVLDIDTSALETANAGGAMVEPVAEPILALIAAADIERGRKLSKACAACHTFDKGGANRTGPNLYNIVNRPHASMDGYAYSDALMATGRVWDYQSLNKLLWKPKKYIPGTKMNYAGMKKPTDRAAIIAWMRTLSDNPADFPTAEEIAAETPQLPVEIIEPVE